MTIKITYYGHAALGFDIGSYHILVDPYFTDNPSTTISPETVPAEFILVTHGHGDHLGDTVSIARRSGALVISNGSICSWLRKQGIKVHNQQIGGGHHHPFGYLKPTFAVHGSSLPDGSDGGNACGFLLTAGEGRRIYVAGDTGLFGDMRLIGEEGIDLAFLPIGDNYTMGPADALRAVKMLQPKHVIPYHYSTFDLIRQDPVTWAQQVEKETETKVHILKPGDSYSLE
jgi:L-ascorbate metabolism protein UlaG (beta-lactamase superfamily)